MTTPTGEIELWIDRELDGQYTLRLRARPPAGDADHMAGPAKLPLDDAALLAAGDDAARYGACLGAAVWSDADVRRTFDEVRAVCEAHRAGLRLRLFMAPGAAALHSLRWEAVCDPRDPETPLLAGRDIHFSRYLASHDWQSVELRRRHDLRGLIAIANPTDLADYPLLAPIDAPAVLARTQAALGTVRTTALAGPGEATVERIVAGLADHDVLYLVAHGLVVGDEAALWLVRAGGETHRVSAVELCDRLREAGTLPSLVVLCSCQSAGTGLPVGVTDAGERGQWGALTAIGPRLSRLGVPAVLALQGTFSVESEARFMPRFFEVLREDGRVDRAAGAARAAVGGRPDWWMPVVFTRLRKGRIWYEGGFGQGGDAQDKWPALVRHIRRSRRRVGEGSGDASPAGPSRRRRGGEGGCTPVIGPAVLEPYVGRLPDLAEGWARKHKFPMARHERGSLPRIAQFLDVKVEQRWVHAEYERSLCAALLRRHGAALTEDQRQRAREDPFLAELMLAVAHHRAARGVEAHRDLAALDLPLYLTVNPDNLLCDLLKEQGKQPVVDICRWCESLVRDEEPVFEPAGSERPTSQRPLIYHLFGHLDDPRSLVLSEDDHFDFLTGFWRYKDHIPAVVRAALSSTALLFMGFRVDGWGFRVLFRAIMNREGAGLAPQLAHVAAQVAPEEGRVIDPAGTRDYLSKYARAANVSLYWGTPDDFLGDLMPALAEDEGT